MQPGKMVWLNLDWELENELNTKEAKVLSEYFGVSLPELNDQVIVLVCAGDRYIVTKGILKTKESYWTVIYKGSQNESLDC